MKQKDVKELQTKNTEELKKLLVETRGELTNMRLEHTQGKLKSPRQLFTKRKEIARMLTALNMKKEEKPNGKNA